MRVWVWVEAIAGPRVLQKCEWLRGLTLLSVGGESGVQTVRLDLLREDLGLHQLHGALLGDAFLVVDRLLLVRTGCHYEGALAVVCADLVQLTAAAAGARIRARVEHLRLGGADAGELVR